MSHVERLMRRKARGEIVTVGDVHDAEQLDEAAAEARAAKKPLKLGRGMKEIPLDRTGRAETASDAWDNDEM